MWPRFGGAGLPRSGSVPLWSRISDAGEGFGDVSDGAGSRRKTRRLPLGTSACRERWGFRWDSGHAGDYQVAGSPADGYRVEPEAFVSPGFRNGGFPSDRETDGPPTLGVTAQRCRAGKARFRAWSDTRSVPLRRRMISAQGASYVVAAVSENRFPVHGAWPAPRGVRLVLFRRYPS